MFKDNGYFLILKRKIFRDIDFACQNYRDSYIKRRIEKRCIANKVNSYQEYLHILNKNPEEYSMLIRDLTVNVTEFFRNSEVFKYLITHVFPKLVDHKVDKCQSKIRMWSAGCSNGAEPYSIAMLFHEYLKDNIDQFYITIYATDLDIECIDNAKNGIYAEKDVCGIQQEYLNKYFIYNDKNKTYEVKEILKDMVKFHNNDLTKDINIGHFDIIFCRNVTIYFSEKMKDEIYDILYDKLNVGGYLILGKTETILGKIKEKFNIVNACERIYQKI